MRTPMSMRGTKVVGALGLGMVLLGEPAIAKERVRQTLTPVADADASGRTRLVLKTASDGRLELQVRRLDPKTTFDVVVNGVKVGTLTTGGGGAGSARFRTRPRGHDLLLGFDPRGATITVRNAAGLDVLQGTLPAGSSGTSADKGVCCVPDDSGTECEDRTADECTARGGTVSTATSCLPNPCDGATPPSGDVVCCIPDDSGPECEDRTASECAAQGGTVVQATSCAPNPCAATPPVDPGIRCCLPDDSGVECEDRTADQCTAQGGVVVQATSCDPNPCAAAPSATPTGDDHGGNNGHGHGQTTATPAAGGDRHGGRTTYY